MEQPQHIPNVAPHDPLRDSKQKVGTVHIDIRLTLGFQSQISTQLSCVLTWARLKTPRLTFLICEIRLMFSSQRISKELFICKNHIHAEFGSNEKKLDKTMNLCFCSFHCSKFLSLHEITWMQCSLPGVHRLWGILWVEFKVV